MDTIRLTTAQAIVRWLLAQRTRVGPVRGGLAGRRLAGGFARRGVLDAATASRSAASSSVSIGIDPPSSSGCRAFRPSSRFAVMPGACA